MFARALTLAAAAATVVSATSVVERTHDVITPHQWQDTWTDCAKQHQTGLVNVGLQTCVQTDIELILVALGHPNKITSKQWQKAWLKCSGQDQTGLINVGAELCLQNEIMGLISVLNIVPIHLPKLPLERSLDVLPLDNLDILSWLAPVPKGLTGKQWQHANLKCGMQEQHGLVNVGVVACLVTQLEAVADILPVGPKRTNEGHVCPKNVKTKQCQEAWLKCGAQEQTGLVNVAVATCLITQFEGLLHLL